MKMCFVWFRFFFPKFLSLDQHRTRIQDRGWAAGVQRISAAIVKAVNGELSFSCLLSYLLY